MKHRLFILIALLSFSFGFTQDFTVDKYTVDITIHKQGYFDIMENYDITFAIPKHSIFRDIQTKYDLLTEEDEQEVRKIKISKVEVPGHTFEKPSIFEQKISRTFPIKIGDAEKMVSGPQHYEIKYRVHNAFLHEADAVKFYWNLKPSDWRATFKSIDFKIHLPPSVEASSDDVFVYSGILGTSTLSQNIEFTVGEGVVEGRSQSSFESNQGESVTLLINLPPNSVSEIKPIWSFWTEYGWIFVSVVLLGGFYDVAS